MVASVEERSTARSMKELPAATDSLPEVVFAGRSNVGKSSLVNFIVNRKALASISATPGHTTKFHFYAVNEGRLELPNFRLVDVPGLGYAETEESVQDSWRSLLERYLAVRGTLGAVFHLIDSRHKITPTDQKMMEMVVRAAEERRRSGARAFTYAIVLTKTDKASAKALAATRAEVTKYVADLAKKLASTPLDGASATEDVINEGEKKVHTKGSSLVSGRAVELSAVAEDMLNVPMIETSSVERRGRVAVWKLLLKVIRR